MLKKIGDFIKKNWRIIAGVLSAVALFLLGRHSADGSGVQSVDDGLDRSKGAAEEAERQNRELGERLDECQGTAAELKQENRELGERLEQCQEKAAGIREDNKGIEERLDGSIRILQEAKKRAEKGEN